MLCFGLPPILEPKGFLPKRERKKIYKAGKSTTRVRALLVGEYIFFSFLKKDAARMSARSKLKFMQIADVRSVFVTKQKN